MTGTLLLHCGAWSATRSDIVRVETPPPTRTWKPIPHSEAIDIVLDQAAGVGLEITQEQYGLSRSGDRLFGVLNFKHRTDDYGFAVGLRNSHDKSMAYGVCAGVKILVCDNLALSGDFSLIRKHTNRSDIRRDIQEAFTTLPMKIEELCARLDTLKERSLTDDGARRILFQAAESGAIASSDMLPVWHEYLEPTFEEFRMRNEYALLMAFTEQAKKFNSAMQLERTYSKLAGVFGL